MTKRNINAILATWGEFSKPKPGDKFLHYKGGIYTIVETGFIEETEAPCVIYRSDENGSVWVRTAKNFLKLQNSME